MGFLDKLFGKKPPEAAKIKRDYGAEAMASFKGTDRYAGFERDMPEQRSALEPTPDRIAEARAREQRHEAAQAEAQRKLEQMQGGEEKKVG